ncbi:hypothetical protein [Roseateles oligotrophus]|uniref:Uncharacterized protein n=1 Tax=Roseateles oligotrophus TaxID=1769250 RepID=A0ABT2YIF0_9BURK|nr:hypothetical protein [Roseateles oligotrophus]MCV2369751.1 hypothetical protein [Roseateles oligotrophus]
MRFVKISIALLMGLAISKLSANEIMPSFLKKQDGQAITITALFYRPVDSTEFELPQSSIKQISDILSNLRPWVPPSRSAPPPKLPGFNNRIALIAAHHPVERITLGISPGCEFILDEKNSIVYVVPDWQRPTLSALLASK